MADFYSLLSRDGLEPPSMVLNERGSLWFYIAEYYIERYVDTYMDVVKIVKGSLQPVAIMVQTLFSISLSVDGMNFSLESLESRVDLLSLPTIA